MAPRGQAAGGRPTLCRRTNKSAFLALFVAAGALWWCCRTVSVGFLGGTAPRVTHAAPGQRSGSGAVARRAFAFDLVKSEDHDGLVVDVQDDGNKRVSTHGSLMYGQWNTVLGDTELPSSGRAYWEVKIVRKPTEAWEYIGVAEPTSDVTQPLARNKKGAGWFWGGSWTESFLYTHLPMRKEWNEKAKKVKTEVLKEFYEKAGLDEKTEMTFQNEPGDIMTGPATHIGMDADTFPPFENGVVVGVDVDMDEGSVGFWADGKFLGKMREPDGKLVNVKGKKLVPALSVYGRTTGGINEYTVMEVRAGLNPP